jgi:hypothetical protein
MVAVVLEGGGEKERWSYINYEPVFLDSTHTCSGVQLYG